MSVPLFTRTGFILAGDCLLMTRTDALLRKLRREHQFALTVPDSTFLSRPERWWDEELMFITANRPPVRFEPTGKVLASALRWIVGESIGGKGNALLWPVDRWKFSGYKIVEENQPTGQRKASTIFHRSASNPTSALYGLRRSVSSY